LCAGAVATTALQAGYPLPLNAFDFPVSPQAPLECFRRGETSCDVAGRDAVVADVLDGIWEDRAIESAPRRCRWRTSPPRPTLLGGELPGGMPPCHGDSQPTASSTSRTSGAPPAGGCRPTGRPGDLLPGFALPAAEIVATAHATRALRAHRGRASRGGRRRGGGGRGGRGRRTRSGRSGGARRPAGEVGGWS
jgi:hypothetical protein